MFACYCSIMLTIATPSIGNFTPLTRSTIAATHCRSIDSLAKDRLSNHVRHDTCRRDALATMLAADCETCSYSASTFRLRRCLAAPRIAAAMPLLDLFFVLAKLLLQPVDHRVHRTHQIVGLVVGHEIVLVLGRDLHVDPRRGLIGQIDDDFDGGEPIENPQQLFRLGRNLAPATRRSVDHAGWKSVSAPIYPRCLVCKVTPIGR